MKDAVYKSAERHMSLTLPKEGWKFDWFGYDGGTGGEYIEVSQVGEDHGFAVINTIPGDSDTGDEIPFTEENFRKEVEEWYEEHADRYR